MESMNYSDLHRAVTSTPAKTLEWIRTMTRPPLPTSVPDHTNTLEAEKVKFPQEHT